MELYEALSNRRKEIGMSFDELQRKTELSLSTLKKILGGHVAAPSFDSVRSIAYAMGITMEELDRRIAGESISEKGSALTTEAQEIAEAFMKADAITKELVWSVINIEKKRSLGLPKSMKQVGTFRGVPMFDAKLDGTAEMKYAARKEQQEIEKEEVTT